MLLGMETFFDNDIAGARARFAAHSRRNPLYLLGVGAVEFLAGVLSLEPAALAQATTVLSATEQFAASLLPRPFKLVALGKWMMGTQPPMSNAELRCRVIRAEAWSAHAQCGYVARAVTLTRGRRRSLLMGFVQLFQESVVNYIRAGFNLRAAWKAYERALLAAACACGSTLLSWQTATRRSRTCRRPSGTSATTTTLWAAFSLAWCECSQSAAIDCVLTGAAKGAINLAISSLPGKIIKLVAIFGLPHDRALGFKLLRSAAEGHRPDGSSNDAAANELDTDAPRTADGALRGVRSPLAALWCARRVWLRRLLLTRARALPAASPVTTC